MFATYAFNGNASMVQVVADVVALICGGSVASLSASCNKALTTVAGAATPYSAPSAQSFGVVQATCMDGVSKKIFRLVATSNVATLQAYDTWNGATNTGTNATTARNCMYLDANPGTLWIVATDEILAIGMANTYCGIGFEIKREAPFMVGTSRPCWGVVTNSAYAPEMPRAKSMTAAGDQVIVPVYLTSPLNGLTFGFPRGADDLNYNQMLPCFAMLQYGGYIYAGAIRGAMCGAEAIGAVGDNYTDDIGRNYLLIKTGAPTPSHKTIAVLRG
ncbi:hypothetical protein [Dechloromonas sp. A34]|uniref:hypothetical protein n=1 Tax=Dechloromonas sp. A34 TaxID=447588 RepID=UPI002248B2A5|nr:hypothetical protein [Dechloromonas sp. A34]